MNKCIKFTITLFIFTSIISGCSRKSYCYFSTTNGMLFINDTSRIKRIIIVKTTPNNRKERNKIFDTLISFPKRSLSIHIDTIKGLYVEMMVFTTNHRDSYFSRIYEKDWLKKEPIKFINQIR